MFPGMNLTVADLMQRFDSGEIRLPLMQRDYIWRPKKVTALLDSLYKDWPIGSFYVWRTEDDHATKTRVGMVPGRRLDRQCVPWFPNGRCAPLG